MGKLIYGIGVNDADYQVQPMINGKRVSCAFYSTWQNMIGRCYSERIQSKYKTYKDCLVCESWLTFSNFKAWMENQDWEGKCLDKDILFLGNKLYSPETCVFVSSLVNTFVENTAAARGDYPVGVSLIKRTGKFEARCSNPFDKKQEHLGCFLCYQKAHQAWRKRKHELACQLAELQTDERVANALRLRYA